MKVPSLIACLLGIMVGLPVIPTEVHAAPVQSKLRIGVIAADSRYVNDARAAYNSLAAQVANLGRFVVVERQDLDAVLREHRLNLAGLTSETGKELKDLEGVDYLLVYSFNHKNMSSRMVESKKGNYYLYTASFAGTVKFVDTQKGIVLDAFEAAGIAESQNAQEAWSGAQADFISRVITGVRTQFALDSRIISKSFRNVKLNRGRSQGVRPGYIFGAFRYGQLVKDPDTGEVLGASKEDTGRIMVFRVEEKFSEAYILDGFYRMQDKDLLVGQPSFRIPRFALDVGTEMIPVASTTNGSAFLTQVGAGVSRLMPESGINARAMLGLGIGTVTPAVSGLLLQGGLLAEYEFLPEILGLYGQAGLDLGLLIQEPSQVIQFPNGKTSNSVQAGFVQPSAALGIRWHAFGPVSFFAEGKYRLPARLDKWTQSSSSGDTRYTYTAESEELRDPEVQFGGMSLKIGTLVHF